MSGSMGVPVSAYVLQLPSLDIKFCKHWFLLNLTLEEINCVTRLS
jgi:hypothetical protein